MIANLSDVFIQDGQIILLHGYSKVVISTLILANKRCKHISVIVTEGKASLDGYICASELSKAGIPVTLISDSSVARYMAGINIILVGAEGVMESGGIVNNVGTYQVAIIAKAFNKPFYVLSESYKFARLYPLCQDDIPQVEQDASAFPVTLPPSLQELPSNLRIQNSLYDYTPPEYVSLLFTDIGILTPSAVSDELIKLYN
uniref:Translation initiation factor eIF-2B subunit alpha n=1 Tax=Lygus hesperus TaxID=30085 RepID=A0A0A9ZIG8_LYGHE